MNGEFISGAAMADLEGLAKILPEGRELHPEALDFVPFGHRVLILVDEVPEDYCGVIIPEEYRDNEKMGAGRVIGVGDMVGGPGIRYPGGPMLSTPSELLYRHVFFGQYAGKPIRLDLVRDSKYMSSVLMLTDMDLWMGKNESI